MRPSATRATRFCATGGRGYSAGMRKWMHLFSRTSAVAFMRAAGAVARSNRRACGHLATASLSPEEERGTKAKKAARSRWRAASRACVVISCLRRRQWIHELGSAVRACASPSDICVGGDACGRGSGCTRCGDRCETSSAPDQVAYSRPWNSHDTLASFVVGFRPDTATSGDALTC